MNIRKQFLGMKIFNGLSFFFLIAILVLSGMFLFHSTAQATISDASITGLSSSDLLTGVNNAKYRLTLKTDNQSGVENIIVTFPSQFTITNGDLTTKAVSDGNNLGTILINHTSSGVESVTGDSIHRKITIKLVNYYGINVPDGISFNLLLGIRNGSEAGTTGNFSITTDGAGEIVKTIPGVVINSNQANINYCTAVTYSDWGNCMGNWRFRSIKTRTPITCVLTAHQHLSMEKACSNSEQNNGNNVNNNANNGNNTGNGKAIDENLQNILTESKIVFGNKVSNILAEVKAKKDEKGESKVAKTYIGELLGNLNPNQSLIQSMVNFITYGTATTKKLGAGERAGIINSYKAAFGDLPSTESDWADVIKIGNGRWPGSVNKRAENRAIASFAKIYLRRPDRTNPHDDAAVVVMTYGLRPANRNLDSEKAAILSFKHIYGHGPSSAVDWDIMRAIAYSGATR